MSAGEDEFAQHCAIYKVAVECEYRFYPKRRWRSDFAIPSKHILIEIEGGTWIQGRHSRGKGMAADMEKYNYAAIMGYRFTPAMVHSGEAIDIIREAIK